MSDSNFSPAAQPVSQLHRRASRENRALSERDSDESDADIDLDDEADESRLFPSSFSKGDELEYLQELTHGGGIDKDGMAFQAGPGQWENAEELGAGRGATYPLDARRGRFPYCLVWTPLPCITWFFPMIGHLGICDSRGVCYDFAGPYFIGVDDLAFGRAVRILRLDPSRITKRREVPVTPPAPPAALADPSGADGEAGRAETGSVAVKAASVPRRMRLQTDQEAWDSALDAGCDAYCKRMHNLVCDNCHSHVARCLNLMGYGGKTRYNMVVLALWVFFKGEYVSTQRALAMWLPFATTVTLILVLRFAL
jgi:hypothetical protein